jgi:hypothetical protein
VKKFYFLILLFSASLFATPIPVKRSIFAVRQPVRFEVHPNFSLNSRTNQTLVIWERHAGNHPGHSTWGRFIGAQGSASGGAFQIVSGPNTYYPSGAYNAASNEFALTFSNEPRGHFVVYIQRLKANGRPIGSPTQVSVDDPTSNLSNDFPQIVFNSGTGNYTVFWLRNGSEAGLYGAVLRGDLSFVNRGIFIRRTEPEGNSGRAPIILDLAYHPLTGKIVILFYQYRPGFTTSTNPDYDYFVGVFNQDLSGIQPASFQKLNPNVVKGNGSGRIHFLPEGTGVIAYADSSNIKLRKISPALKISGPVYAAFKPPLTNQKLFHPAIAFSNGTSGLRGIVIAAQDPSNNEANGTIWAQELDAQARPFGSPFSVERNFDRMGEQRLVSIGSNASSPIYRFASVYVHGVQRDIPPGPTESSGLILLNFGFNH